MPSPPQPQCCHFRCSLCSECCMACSQPSWMSLLTLGKIKQSQTHAFPSPPESGSSPHLPNPHPQTAHIQATEDHYCPMCGTSLSSFNLTFWQLVLLGFPPGVGGKGLASSLVLCLPQRQLLPRPSLLDPLHIPDLGRLEAPRAQTSGLGSIWY